MKGKHLLKISERLHFRIMIYQKPLWFQILNYCLVSSSLPKYLNDLRIVPETFPRQATIHTFQILLNMWYLKLRESQSLTLLVMLCYDACRQEPSITTSWEASSTDAETQTSIWPSFWSHVEEEGIGLREPEASRTPQEDIQSQLVWAMGAHRDWTTNQRACRAGPRPSTHMCRCAARSSWRTPNNWNKGCL